MAQCSERIQPRYSVTAPFSDGAPLVCFCLSNRDGRLDEAIAEEQRAHELEPLSLIIGTNLGTLLYLARQYDRAIDQYRKALEIDPNFIIAHWMLALAYEQKKMYTEALAELRTAVALSARNSIALALLGHVLAQSGSKGEAQEILGELNEVRKRTYVSSYRVAAIYEGLDEREQAFEWLQRAYDERDPWLIWLKLDPVLDNLRSDARFEELTRRLGLPPVG